MSLPMAASMPRSDAMSEHGLAASDVRHVVGDVKTWSMEVAVKMQRGESCGSELVWRAGCGTHAPVLTSVRA